MTPPQDKTAAFYSGSKRLARAIREANRRAARRHKLLGHAVVVWRDGKVVRIPPEEIEIPAEPNGADPPR
jgi:hypothetical protein